MTKTTSLLSKPFTLGGVVSFGDGEFWRVLQVGVERTDNGNVYLANIRLMDADEVAEHETQRAARRAAEAAKPVMLDHCEGR